MVTTHTTQPKLVIFKEHSLLMSNSTIKAFVEPNTPYFGKLIPHINNINATVDTHTPNIIWPNTPLFRKSKYKQLINTTVDTQNLLFWKTQSRPTKTTSVDTKTPYFGKTHQVISNSIINVTCWPQKLLNFWKTQTTYKRLKL